MDLEIAKVLAQGGLPVLIILVVFQLIRIENKLEQINTTMNNLSDNCRISENFPIENPMEDFSMSMNP